MLDIISCSGKQTHAFAGNGFVLDPDKDLLVSVFIV